MNNPTEKNTNNADNYQFYFNKFLLQKLLIFRVIF